MKQLTNKIKVERYRIEYFKDGKWNTFEYEDSIWCNGRFHKIQCLLEVLNVSDEQFTIYVHGKVPRYFVINL